MKVVPIIAAIVLLAAIVPIVADDSSAYSVSSYSFTYTSGDNEGEYIVTASFVFNGSISADVPDLEYYSDSSCSNLLIEASVISFDTTSKLIVWNAAISDCPGTVYAMLSYGSQYSIYEVSIYEEYSGSDTSLTLSSAGVDSVSYSDSLFTFFYVWDFEDDLTDYYSSAYVEYCSDSSCSDVVSTWDEFLALDYDSDSTTLWIVNSVSLSDFYLKLYVGSQTWVSHVEFSVSEDESSATVETDETEETTSSSTSLIFDSADTLLKVLAVLGCVLVVVFVVFGFGMKNTRRVRR